MDEYDFVVVGGGTARCVLAARLTEEPDARVLLLKAGGAQVLGNPLDYVGMWGSSVDEAAADRNHSFQRRLGVRAGTNLHPEDPPGEAR